jgi:hypothetical protein
MGIRKNFSYLAKSRYLILIAVLVVTFNIVMNLVEVVFGKTKSISCIRIPPTLMLILELLSFGAAS